MRSQRRVDEAADHAGARLIGDAPRHIRNHDDMEMSGKFFMGATILATGLLIKAGAPLVPVVMGIAMAAFSTGGGASRDREALSRPLLMTVRDQSSSDASERLGTDPLLRRTRNTSSGA